MKFALLTTAALALALSACSSGDAPVNETTQPDGEAAAQDAAPASAPAVAEPATVSAEAAIVAEARACQGASDTSMLTVDVPEAGNQDGTVNAAAAIAYLDAVRAEPCVFELPSGLLFRIREASEAGISPVSGDLVTVHYRGMFAYGGEFDSSYARGEPATFPSNRLIAGWVEALPLMRVGEAWDLFIAPELAYGPRGTPGGPIGPNEALVFQLELIDVPGAN
ncbi:FKBP-type peptidyl-prolyl cis-trans isomerase [Maricaulis salignorans]|uniref:FKBP-type peptidyl-prolyl cis-trans isomerase n=1 Tax=Maricaulis salignorans TaxID=144026 RepID=UPI003A8E5EFD